MPKTSNEMFYLDEHGNKQDADLWADLLAEDEVDLIPIREGLLAEDFSLEEVDSLWPLPVKTADREKRDGA